MKNKIDDIHDEIQKITKNLNAIAITCDDELTNVVENIDQGILMFTSSINL